MDGAAALVLGGCSSRFFSPYQMEIQQGNYITEREVALLREGRRYDDIVLSEAQGPGPQAASAPVLGRWERGARTEG